MGSGSTMLRTWQFHTAAPLKCLDCNPIGATSVVVKMPCGGRPDGGATVLASLKVVIPRDEATQL